MATLVEIYTQRAKAELESLSSTIESLCTQLGKLQERALELEVENSDLLSQINEETD